MPQKAATTVATIFVDSLLSRGYFWVTFHKVALDLRSTRCVPTMESTEKHKKSLTWQKICFLCSRAFHRVSLDRKKRFLTCTNDSPWKKVPFQKKTILRTMAHLSDISLVKGSVPSARFFSTFRPARDTQFEPIAPSALASAVHQRSSLSDVSSINRKQQSATFQFTLSSLWLSMAIQPSAAVLHNSKSLKKL